MRVWGLMLVAIAGAVAGEASAQRRPDATPPGDVDVTDAIVIGPSLVVIDRDARVVRAIDVTTRAERWHTQVEQVARGRHTLHALGDAGVLVLVGGQRVVLSLADGHEVSRSADRGGGDRGFDGRGGVCLTTSACSVDLVDCTDTHALANDIHGRLISRMRFDRSGWDSGCWGFGVYPIGRAGNHLLLAAIHVADGAATASELRSYDARTGALEWRTPAPAAVSTPSDLCGVSRDGTFAWWLDFSGGLAAFDTTNGRVRFTRSTAGAASPPSVAGTLDGSPRSLFVQLGERALLLDARSGRVRWQVPTPRALAFPAGLSLRGGVLAAPATSVWVLDPRDGHVLSRAPVSQPTRLAPTADSGVDALDTRLGWDARGAPRAAMTAAPSVSVERGRASATVRRLGDGASIVRFAHDAWLIGAFASAGRTYNAIMLAPTATTRRIRILETTP